MLRVTLPRKLIFMTAELREQHIYTGERSGLGRAGLQTGDQGGSVETACPRASYGFRVCHGKRQPDIHGFADLRSKELGRRHAHDCERVLAADDGFPEKSRVLPKSPLPIPVTDHSHGMIAKASVLFHAEGAADDCL